MNNRLKELRYKLNLSADDMGAFIGVSHASISDWENGKRPIPASKQKLLCEVYNVNPEWLETGRGDMFLRKKSVAEIEKAAFLRVIKDYWGDLPPKHKELLGRFFKSAKKDE